MIYKVENLVYSYDKKNKVLDGINLEINQGELLCILGKNGAGKSTLFKCLLKLLKVENGTVFLNQKDINGILEKDIAKVVSYVSQNNESVFGFTVFEYVMMGLASEIGLFSHPSKKEEDKVLDILETMNLMKYKDRQFKELSGGERQEVAIARALVSNPSIVLFDEPTAHLDYSNQTKVLKMIKDLSGKGYTIVLTTHDPNHAIMLDGNVALLDNNRKIKKGSVKELINEENLKEIYGENLRIKYIDEFKRNVIIHQM